MLHEATPAVLPKISVSALWDRHWRIGGQREQLPVWRVVPVPRAPLLSVVPCL